MTVALTIDDLQLAGPWLLLRWSTTVTSDGSLPLSIAFTDDTDQR